LTAKLSRSGGWMCPNHIKYYGSDGMSCFGNFVFFLFVGSFLE
jgi:hypothetical protein